MKKFVLTILSSLILLGCVMPGNAFALTSYKLQDHALYFDWFAGGFAFPQVKSFTVNIYLDYEQLPDLSDRIDQIETFAKIDEPNPGTYTVGGVNVNSVYIDSTSYSSLTNNDNVIVDPDWIWSCKYKDFYLTFKPAGTSYKIKGKASTVLSLDCIPNAFSRTTSKTITNP